MKKFLSINVVVAFILGLSVLTTVYLGREDMVEILTLPIYMKISKIAMFFMSVLIFLRLRDYILGYKFSIEDVRDSQGLGIYFGLTVLGLMLGIAIIVS